MPSWRRADVAFPVLAVVVAAAGGLLFRATWLSPEMSLSRGACILAATGLMGTVSSGAGIYFQLRHARAWVAGLVVPLVLAPVLFLSLAALFAVGLMAGVV